MLATMILLTLLTREHGNKCRTYATYIVMLTCASSNKQLAQAARNDATTLLDALLEAVCSLIAMADAALKPMHISAGSLQFVQELGCCQGANRCMPLAVLLTCWQHQLVKPLTLGCLAADEGAPRILAKLPQLLATLAGLAGFIAEKGLNPTAAVADIHVNAGSR